MTKKNMTFLLWLVCLIVGVCSVIYLSQAVPWSSLDAVNSIPWSSLDEVN